MRSGQTRNSSQDIPLKLFSWPVLLLKNLTSHRGPTLQVVVRILVPRSAATQPHGPSFNARNIPHRRFPDVTHSWDAKISFSEDAHVGTATRLSSSEARRTSLSLGRVIGRRRYSRRSRRHVHILSRTRIMQLLTGFFLNRFFVALQSLYPLRVEIVFLLLLRDLLLQRFILHPLLLVHHHPIRAQHHMHKQQARQHRHSHGSNAPPPRIHPRRHWTHPLHPRHRQRLGLWSPLCHRPQPVLRAGKSSNSRRILH